MNEPIPADFQPARILVCQQRQIGDVILATPLVRMLRDRYPRAEIHFFTEPKCAPVLKDNPDIARVWLVDKTQSLWGALRFYLAIRHQRFDLVVSCQQLPRCNAVTLFSGARYRLVESAKWYNRLIYTHSSCMHGGYATKVKACALAPLGLEWNGERPYVHVPEPQQAWAESWLRDNGFETGDELITVDPTHKSDTRRWPAGHYARLIDLLLEQRPDLRFLLSYGPGEEDQTRAVYDACARKDRCIVPRAIMTLNHLAALQQQAVLHLGNCSAPRHLALAVGTPTFTLIGATNGASWTYPGPDQTFTCLEDLPCRCNRDECADGTLACTYGLLPEAVAPQVLAHLDRCREAGATRSGPAGSRD